jgi:hypothetical protein
MNEQYKQWLREASAEHRRLVAAGCDRDEAAARVDACFVPFRDWIKEYGHGKEMQVGAEPGAAACD